VRFRGELARYVLAAVAYIALGVAVPEALFSWIEGAAFLLVAVWILPAIVERLR
jgi:putative Ca2+/H+ antiporter (TMEM165/GDT1 family)